MLKKMFDFSIKHSWKSAIGFYIFYSILVIMFGFLSIFVLALFVKFFVHYTSQYNHSLKAYSFFIDNIFYYVLCTGLCLLFIFKKQLRCPFSIFLLILSIPLTFIDGDIWGLIPATILSTFPNRNISE